jgi:DNA-binding XRE family transcriptional regulator
MMGKGNRTIPDEVKQAYLEWLLTPPGEREPATKAEMAEHLNVAVSTLWRWEKEPEFQEELRHLKTKWGVAFHADILGRLIKIIAEGTDTAAIQAAKVLLPHIDTGPRVSKEDDINYEELLAIKQALTAQGYAVTEDNG